MVIAKPAPLGLDAPDAASGMISIVVEEDMDLRLRKRHGSSWSAGPPVDFAGIRIGA
jgi:hypothetical protein